jgi:DNA-binding transcriptional regulator YiaG
MTGEELKKLRKEAGLTQTDLAIKLGTHKQVISTWENNRHKISNAYEVLILQILEK